MTLTSRARATLTAVLALTLAASVQVSTPTPAHAATHKIVHQGISDVKTVLVSDGNGRIYYLPRELSISGVHRLFVPYGCKGYERHVFPLAYKIRHRFGAGPKWVDVSGHTHGTTHRIDIQC